MHLIDRVAIAELIIPFLILYPVAIIVIIHLLKKIEINISYAKLFVFNSIPFITFFITSIVYRAYALNIPTNLSFILMVSIVIVFWSILLIIYNLTLKTSITLVLINLLLLLTLPILSILFGYFIVGHFFGYSD